MRFALVIALCLAAPFARAQEQERKLVNRLLEPNTTLENSQQDKKFNGANSVTTAAASSHRFYVTERKLSQDFAGTRQFVTAAASSRSFGTRSANLPPPSRTRTFPAGDARDVSSARESSSRYDTRSFAGNRRFLGRGKSQKSLHAQDHPLSIDDIRELLNKNK